MNILKNLNKYKNIVIGVSGGPDSMALLDMLRQQGYQCHVVSVNYHKRETALRDQQIVQNYCQKYQIPCYVYDDFESLGGNFQKEARDYRYRCYQEIYQKVKACGLYLGHHQNDHLETIIFQLQTHRYPKVMGLIACSRHHQMKIYRPLLQMTKQDVLEYCHQHQLEYGIDETNFEPIYTRNKIRMVIQELSQEDQEKLLEIAGLYNLSQSIKRKIAKRFLKQKNRFDLKGYQRYSLGIRLVILQEFLNTDWSMKQLEDFDKKLFSNKHQQIILENQQILLVEYQCVSIHPLINYEFEVIFDRINYVNCERFKLKRRGKLIEGCTLSPSDFPITIRNARLNDQIVMRFGTKKVNRFFIDRKIRSENRWVWPVIENCKGDIVFVSGLGCDKNHYSDNHNLYLIRK